MSDTTAAIVPAAGRSSRFGSAKLLASIRGEPLLQHTLRSLVDAGVDRIVVVARADHGLDDVPLLSQAQVSVVVNDDPDRGMFSSIRTGLAAVSASRYLILPADMPFVRVETIDRLLAASRSTADPVVAMRQGRRGHPLIIPHRFREALLAADGGGSLKDALQSRGAASVRVEVDDDGVLRDVDRPDDLEMS
jgi:molybdenum cofactor cytidylyltransferase